MLRQTIESGATGPTPRRVFLPPAIVCCAQCGEQTVKQAYEIRKSESRGLRKFFCSNPCWAKHQNEQMHGRRVCVRCAEPAPRRRSFGSARDGFGPYCSKHCLSEDMAERRTAYWARHERVCPQCNNTFRALSRGAGERARFCSRECADRAHSLRMSGDKNPRWKDGATPGRQQPHAAKAFRAMRPRILERDGRKCVVCGAVELRLEVHHIDNQPMNNAARNLVTLCAPCHRKWHAAADGKQKKILWPWLKTYAEKPVSTTCK